MQCVGVAVTLPHQCRCAICGEIGTIVPGLPNVFAPPVSDATKAMFPATLAALERIDVPPLGIERRAIVPAGTSGDSAYASSRADELAPRGEPSYTEVATCTHGYTRCMICKFPAP